MRTDTVKINNPFPKVEHFLVPSIPFLYYITTVLNYVILLELYRREVCTTVTMTI